MLYANTVFSPFFWMEREMARKTEAIPLIFNSNWFLPFCRNLSETLKHISFMYGMMGQQKDGSLCKGKLQKSYQMASLLFFF